MDVFIRYASNLSFLGLKRCSQQDDSYAHSLLYDPHPCSALKFDVPGSPFEEYRYPRAASVPGGERDWKWTWYIIQIVMEIWDLFKLYL
jgi:hypothetical protein